MESFNNISSKNYKKHIKTCDIVIPTYYNNQSLQKCLHALQSQDVPTGWSVRVIICDDGPSYEAEQITNSFLWNTPWLTPIFTFPMHRGRAGARNAGIAIATANIILLLADDIVLQPRALAEHLTFHEIHQDTMSAGLGWVVWDPVIIPTPFMEWMVHGGQQNDYDALLGQKTCDPSSYFYGSNVSVKRSVLQENRFAESFSMYGWEDLELGSRLKSLGLILHPLDHAVGLHAHFSSSDALLDRQCVIGARRYLVNTNVMRRIKHEIYHYSGARFFIRFIMKKMGNRLNNPRFFQFVVAGEFWYGVHHADRILKMFTKNDGLSTELSTIIPHKTNTIVIIVHFGPKANTIRCIDSLLGGDTVPDTIIVVDHGDESFTDAFDTVVCIRPTQNNGYASGLLFGLAYAREHGARNNDIIVLANNDLIFHKASIVRIVNWWKKNGSASLLAGPVVGSVSLLSGRAHITKPAHQLFWTRPYVHGSCMVAELSLFSQFSLSDQLFMYWEDVLFSRTIVRDGGTLLAIPNLEIHHNDDIGPVSQDKLYYLVRNGAYVIMRIGQGPWRLYWNIVHYIRILYHKIIGGSRHHLIARALRDSQYMGII